MDLKVVDHTHIHSFNTHPCHIIYHLYINSTTLPFFFPSHPPFSPPIINNTPPIILSYNINTGEVKHKYDDTVMNLFTEVFNWLPVAAVISNKPADAGVAWSEMPLKSIFVVHGGLR